MKKQGEGSVSAEREASPQQDETAATPVIETSYQDPMPTQNEAFIAQNSKASGELQAGATTFNTAHPFNEGSSRKDESSTLPSQENGSGGALFAPPSDTLHTNEDQRSEINSDLEKLKKFFAGIAVVIDDEINKQNSSIRAIIDQIRSGGCHVVELSKLPEDDDDLSNLRGASFFVMDWQLEPSLISDAEGTLTRIQLPRGAEKAADKKKLNFLSKLTQERLAPMFIFTSENIENVKEVLSSDEKLYVEGQPTHILVESKENVKSKEVFNVLADWLNRTPSALVLKTWEQEYEKAKNDMFFDFYAKSVDWPVLLWKTFDDDGIPASDELGRLITRIIFSRMTPFHLEMGRFIKPPPTQADEIASYRGKLLQVLEGERFVPAKGLHADSIAPGDVFKVNGKFYINIRPDCDCIARGGEDDITLYVLRGEKISAKKADTFLDREYGTLREKDSEAAVFAMHQGESIVFNLKNLESRKWSEVRDKRIGRLLPPFLTRLQQRYASYLQRPGLPKIPREAMPPAVAPAANSNTPV